ncbi:MAG: hypothetical protein ABT940_11695 [Alphaproteobacteria bacterium]
MKSALFDDSPNGGGVISGHEIVDQIANNVWPDVSMDDLARGSVRFRKLFVNNIHPDTALTRVRVYLQHASLAPDRIVIFPGTDSDTRVALTGAERLYGCGMSDIAVSAGASWIAVNVASAKDAIFRDGDLVRVAGAGKVEFVRLAASGAVAWNGNRAVLTFADGQTLADAYPCLTTCVSSCIEADGIPPALPVWEQYLIPAGVTGVLGGNTAIGVTGESAS